jgi:hypothetical protein
MFLSWRSEQTGKHRDVIHTDPDSYFEEKKKEPAPELNNRNANCKNFFLHL